MPQKLTEVANIHVKPDKIDLVKAKFLKLIEPALIEEDCINHNLHQDNENPTHFIFYENREAEALIGT